MDKLSLRLILLTLSVLVASSFGCAKNELTKEKAKNIIAEHYNYPKPVYRGLMVGKKSHYYGKAMEEQKQKMINNIFDPLVKEGLIRYNLYPEGDIDVLITEEGKKFIEGTVRNDRPDTVNIKVAEKLLVDVTDIVSEDSSGAQVEYTWKYGKITPFGKYMKGDKWKSTELNKESIKMKLYDDGWKVAEQ
jgi:hypothetical protein